MKNTDAAIVNNADGVVSDDADAAVEINASEVEEWHAAQKIYGWAGMRSDERDAVMAVWDGRSRLGAPEVCEILENAGLARS